MIDYQTRYQNLFAAVKEYLDADEVVGMLQVKRAKIDTKIDAVRRRREALLVLEEMILNYTPPDLEKDK